MTKKKITRSNKMTKDKIKMTPKKLWLAAVILFSSSLTVAFAYDDYSPAELSRTNPMARAGRKLGRGTSNLLLGWVEIPRGIQTVGRESGFAASMTWGVLQGAGTALRRTVLGAAEIVTFPLGAPSKDGDPLIEPEYIL